VRSFSASKREKFPSKRGISTWLLDGQDGATPGASTEFEEKTGIGRGGFSVGIFGHQPGEIKRQPLEGVKTGEPRISWKSLEGGGTGTGGLCYRIVFLKKTSVSAISP